MSEGGEVTRGYRIHGRVQGVFFRVWTRDVARDMGIRGGVRNLSNGSVEAWGEASVEMLDTFEKKLWVGPPAAKVEGVEVTESGGPFPESGFEILYQ